MQNKTKNEIITIGFITILGIIFCANIIVKDEIISTSERRKLAQFPEISIKEVLNGDVMEKWEKYVEDQFVGRDFFRGIKAFWSTKVFAQKDNNNLFEKNNAIYKMEYPLNENNIKKSAQKINEVYEKYLKNMNVYYSIIPDKNYYLENDEHLKLDYNKVDEIMKNELSLFKYIDIRSGLDLDDYYRTDLHWKQENLQDVVNIIQNNMGLELRKNNYEVIDKGEFYGGYYGQLATNIYPDNLYILTNETIQQCTTYNFEKQNPKDNYGTISCIFDKERLKKKEEIKDGK